MQNQTFGKINKDVISQITDRTFLKATTTKEKKTRKKIYINEQKKILLLLVNYQNLLQK